ncbi:hypothetical protein [Azohydromonas australica]|uniref:hypothetical protein n=1 Tax=Azohydromonas australica TaxID=364039 RepID=UPI00048E04E1|nr:hypothetical protein [Azohydromonas australica]
MEEERLGACDKFRVEPRRQPQVLAGSHQPAARDVQGMPVCCLGWTGSLLRAAQPAFAAKRQPAKLL